MGETSAYIVLSNDADKHRAIYDAFAEGPNCSFGGAGVVLGDDGLTALPYEPHDAICPFCKSQEYDHITEVLDGDNDVDEDIVFECRSCRRKYGIRDVNSGKSNWYLARNYIFISDIDADEWEDGSVKKQIMEELPGVIDVVIGWGT